MLDQYLKIKKIIEVALLVSIVVEVILLLWRVEVPIDIYGIILLAPPILLIGWLQVKALLCDALEDEEVRPKEPKPLPKTYTNGYCCRPLPKRCNDSLWANCPQEVSACCPQEVTPTCNGYFKV